MSQSSDSEVLGVVLVIRHGDRQGFYQDPNTYTATATQITPLGNQEEYQLGEYLNNLYFNASSPSHIPEMGTGLFNESQVLIRADLGGEDGVVYDSCMSLVQGLWPPSPNNTVSLANGTTITAPLGGYQYVPIESVDPNLDVSLEGFLDCNTFDDSTTAFYNSTEFQEKASESAAFLSLLPPYLDGRAVTLENMWNIFDFMNVESIHNAAFAKALPTTFLAQARALANWHEYNVFSSPQIGGIGNIAGQTMVLSILNGLSAIVDPTNPQKFVYEAVAYKPILSLFNMTGVAAANPELAGIVNYAGAVAFEVRQPSSGGEPVVRFNFKNGTDSDFVTYNYMNRTGDVPLSVFIDTLAPVGVNTTADWCNVCQNNQDRGCSALTLAYNQGHAAASTKISPVGAGFLGAGLTIAVIAILFGVLAFMGLLTLGRLSKRARKETDSDTKA